MSPGAVIVQPEPDFQVGDSFCAYLAGLDVSRFLTDVSTPPTRDTVEAPTARHRGKRTLVTKQSAALSATGFRDYADANGMTPYLDSIFNSGTLAQFMYFPATDEPSGVYGWAGNFLFTENDGPAAVGAANAVSISATSPNERSLIRSIQPQREFVDGDFPVEGDIVNHPDPSGAVPLGIPTNFGGKGFIQIMALDVTGVADVAIEIAHSTDGFAADDNQLIDLGTYGDTAGNIGGRQEFDFLLADDVLVNKDLRVKLTKAGVGTIDKLQLVVGFFRALTLVKP